MSVTVRRARPEEAVELTKLILLSKQSNGYDDAFMAACVDELSVSAEDIRSDMIWVAVGQTLLGCVTLKPDTASKRGEISSFFVHPESKRQGVGKCLWQTVLHAARGADLTHLRLDADPAAVPFYEAIGFTVIGQKPSGSIPGRFLPLMELTLADTTPAEKSG